MQKQIRSAGRTGTLLAGCAAVAVGVAAVLAALGTVQSAHARPAGRVGPWDAMKAATTKVPGSKAYGATYAEEGGHWIYDVIVIKGKKISEVEVDAATGKAMDVEAATPEEEGREMVADLHKAIGDPVKARPAEKGEKDEDEKGEKPGG